MRFNHHDLQNLDIVSMDANMHELLGAAPSAACLPKTVHDLLPADMRVAHRRFGAMIAAYRANTHSAHLKKAASTSLS